MSEETDNQSLVSIVTPSYNQGQFIEDTILSVKNQDYPNIEHIIVDGGSTDKTLEVLKKYEGTYNMRWISEPDEGQADAVNKGFEMANGEIIGWLNSDDVYFSREAISHVVEEFLKKYDIDVLYGDIALISQDNEILKIQCVSQFNYKKLLRGCYLEQPAIFFRDYIAKKNKLDIKLNYVMDYELWLRLGRKYNFHHINEILAGDRNHPYRKILNQRSKMKEETRRVMKKHGQEFGIAYYLSRIYDKLFYGFPGRVKGVYKIFLIQKEKNYTISFKLGLNKEILLNQLWRKNREII